MSLLYEEGRGCKHAFIINCLRGATHVSCTTRERRKRSDRSTREFFLAFCARRVKARLFCFVCSMVNVLLCSIVIA